MILFLIESLESNADSKKNGDLRNTDPRNDGQVIFYDQVIPGASLFGYINLDHWAIAVPVKEKTASSAWEATATHPHVRAILFEAMILFLVEKLSL